MDRIATAFEKAHSEGRTCFVAYVCAGDPDYATSLKICHALAGAGVDVLELGVPFSDPLADGLANQLAAQRALESGMDQAQVFALTREVRAAYPDLPIVYYTYFNLVFAPGIENYVARAAGAGVDALLTLDCPPEEAGELLAASRQHGMKNIFIVAPTTPPERMATIARAATGFIYYVSREGVTGERDQLPPNIGEAVAEIKRHTDLPVAVGFGISKREHVEAVGKVADAAVVGSAIVSCIAQDPKDPAAILDKLGARLGELMGTA